jgi:hypothetical protein
MRITKFFQQLREGQPKATYQAFAYIDAAQRFTESWSPTTELPTDPQPKYTDWYFTPLVFTEPKRANETATGFVWLFADLDEADHKDAPIKPTLVWETSPGRQQALWRLSDPIPTYKMWADINQRLTRASGADSGGWPGAKLLRVPTSLHWKGASPVAGRWLVTDGPVHSPVRVASVLPTIHRPTISEGAAPPQMGQSEWERWIGENHKRIPMSVKAYLVRHNVADRSLHLVKVAGLCKGMGLTQEDTFHILSGVSWNKWRDKPDMLWQQIAGVFAP